MSGIPSKREIVDTFAPVNTQTWVGGRHTVRCVNVISETWDVKTFCFMAEQPVMYFFKPGQFITLELDINGEQVMRTYTISSSPSVPYSISITVKRVPNGRVSAWLHDNMDVGTELAVHGPAGDFNCIDFAAPKILLLSGGVGITPVMSMMRWFFDTNSDVDLVFVHSARTPRDFIFHRELEHMCSRMHNFSLHLISETYGNGQVWSGYRGFLDEAKLSIMAEDFMEREIFCCGPQPYMDAIKKLLSRSGFDMSHYHEESFGASPLEVQEEVAEQAAIAQQESDAISTEDMCQVSFSLTGKSVTIAPNETIHTAAAKLGMHIPKACGMGICGTCKVLKTKGEVEMNHNGGITDEDLEEGYILSCCSVPKGPVEIEF